MLVPRPDKFSGEVSDCKGFLLQCSLFFTAQIGTTDQQRIAQFINLITGKMLQWATTISEKGGEPTSYERFVEQFMQVFNHCLEGMKIGEWLLAL